MATTNQTVITILSSSSVRASLDWLWAVDCGKSSVLTNLGFSIDSPALEAKNQVLPQSDSPTDLPLGTWWINRYPGVVGFSPLHHR